MSSDKRKSVCKNVSWVWAVEEKWGTWLVVWREKGSESRR